MNKELTVQEAALAWAQGKKVEARPRLSGAWTLVRPHVSNSGHQYSADVLLDPSFIFRLAPEPPEKRYRPWTAEEVPVGAQVRYRGSRSSARMLIVSSEERGMLGLGSLVSYPELFDVFEHSTDKGATWKLCGVEVES